MPITKHLIKGHKNPEAVINVVNYISNSSFLAECGRMGIFMPTTEDIYNEYTKKTVWPDQRCPIIFAISDDGGKTWPYKRIIEPGEGFVGEFNNINNRRYEYPVKMQSKDGKIHGAYSFGNRRCVKYVCVDETWNRGEKNTSRRRGSSWNAL